MERLRAILFLAVLLAGRPGGAPSAVATLTGVHGVVQVKARGQAEWMPVHGTQVLGEGTALRVGPGGRALLLQPGCPPRLLPAGTTLLVSAEKRWLTGISRRRVTAAQQRSVLQFLASAARSSRSQPTAVRSDQPLEEIALSPRRERVLDGRPTFIWRDDGPGSRYALELYRGDTLVWSANSTVPHLAYPAARPPLKPGRYQWQVAVTMPDGEQDMGGAGFTVPEPAAARRIRAAVAAARALVPSGAGPNLPLIAGEVQQQLYSPAAAALQNGLTENPGDRELRLLLAHVYMLMGREQARAQVLKQPANRQ